MKFRITVGPRFVASGSDSLSTFRDAIAKVAPLSTRYALFIDEFFLKSQQGGAMRELVAGASLVIPVTGGVEPTTDFMDELVRKNADSFTDSEIVTWTIVALGGGTTMDTAKAFSVLVTNATQAASLQGWDLVVNPGISKIGIPSIPGTGSESSRTAVLTNSDSGLKLGINSDFSAFDAVILDPNLMETLPVDVYVFSAMDAYLHAEEILTGSLRNPLGDSLAHSAKKLIEDGLLSPNPTSLESRQKVLLASFFAGQALTSGYVGLVHPVSAAVGVVFGYPHSVANVITLLGLSHFYPEAAAFCSQVFGVLGIQVPKLEVRPAIDVEAVYELAMQHDKPLVNFLGEGYRERFTLRDFSDFLGRVS